MLIIKKNIWTNMEITKDKFEYKVIILDNLYSIKTDTAYNYPIYYLNTLGDEGWEVCAVDGNKYLLKRKMN